MSLFVLFVSCSYSSMFVCVSCFAMFSSGHVFMFYCFRVLLSSCFHGLMFSCFCVFCVCVFMFLCVHVLCILCFYVFMRLCFYVLCFHVFMCSCFYVFKFLCFHVFMFSRIHVFMFLFKEQPKTRSHNLHRELQSAQRHGPLTAETTRQCTCFVHLGAHADEANPRLDSSPKMPMPSDSAPPHADLTGNWPHCHVGWLHCVAQ